MNHVIESRRVVCVCVCVGPVEYMGEKSNVYGVLVTEAEGKGIIGGPKCRWTKVKSVGLSKKRIRSHETE